jgi:serine/threonine protein kinase
MTDGSATGEWTPPPPGPAAWPTVPGYEIVAELGRGGMGVVYQARTLRGSHPVAVKVIRDGALAGPRERARFRAEALAMSNVRHPNVVTLYEANEYAGVLYYTMELLADGLDRRLARQPVAVREAAELVRTLALVVQFAHGRGIVHRDLKPANVLLDGPTPKIADFGLVKRLGSESTAWTQDGAVLGTPNYMAPEQAAGRVAEVGPAVDIYSLGAILYELLAGRPPFRADTWQRTIEHVLNDEPVRLPAAVPRDLETICLKCLEKRPEDRYGRADELAADLDRFLTGRPPVAVPTPDGVRLARAAARDGYELLGELGRGPCGVVYRAAVGSFKQPAAVKVFAGPVADRAAWQAWFDHTAGVAAAFAHPQVVAVQKSGWWDGRPFVVTDLAPAGSLAGQLGGKPRPVAQSLRLVAGLAEVVCYLHRQGVVHGNLKPTNVLLAADGIPRLADVRPPVGLVPADAPDPYRSPELANPSAEPRPYTDTYGLAAVLYALLTGRPPADEPAPPSAANAAVPPEVDGVCLRGLRRNPWQRFTRAYDLLTRLRQLQKAAEAMTGKRRTW